MSLKAQPLVSVVIPSFNRQGALPRAVQSVLTQTYQNWELHIVDDGSTDETAKVCEPWLKNSRVSYHYQPNKGVSAARNQGISLAQGEWLAFLDSDDEWLPEKLQTQMQGLLKSDLFWSHTEELWVRNGKEVNKPQKYKKSGGDIFNKCVELCAIGPSTAVIHESLFQALGKFNEEYVVCEDYECWLRFALGNQIHLEETPLTKKYGGHADQLSTTYKAMDYWRAKALVKILKEAGVSLEQKTIINESLSSKCEILLRGYEKHNNMDKYQEVKGWLT